MFMSNSVASGLTGGSGLKQFMPVAARDTISYLVVTHSIIF